MAKAVKLADIAEKVNVSTVTVSKALSNQKGVSEELRARIKELAEEMGYKQPSAIRKERAQKSYNIGIIISEVFLVRILSLLSASRLPDTAVPARQAALRFQALRSDDIMPSAVRQR